MNKNDLILNTSQARILKSLPDYVRILDTDGNIIFYNHKKMKEFPVYGHNCRCIENEYDGPRQVNQDNIIEALDIISQKEETIDNRTYSVRCAPIEDKQGNPIAVAEVFRDVTRKRELQKAVEKNNLNLESDLDFAKTIQMRLLPKKGEFENITIDHFYRPSHKLSGDIFDIYKIDDNHIGMYMVDVAGHGIAAAMMTVFIRQSMESIFDQLLSPKNTLIKMQEKFMELGLEPNRYFTMYCGVYSIKDKKFTYANGGHNCVPYLFNDVDKLTMLESYGHPILGFQLDDELTFDEKEIYLDCGDKILFYTDGIIEATNRDNEEFGVDRIKEVIINRPRKVLTTIMDVYDRFTDLPQEDDIALLLLKIK